MRPGDYASVVIVSLRHGRPVKLRACKLLCKFDDFMKGYQAV